MFDCEGTDIELIRNLGIKVELAEFVDFQKWDALVRSLGGTIFHSSVWDRYVRASQLNASPRFITLFADNGTVLAAALGWQLHSVRFSGLIPDTFNMAAMPVMHGDSKSDLSQTIADSGESANTGSSHSPAEASPPILATFVKLLERHLRQSGIMFMELGSMASPSAAGLFMQAGFSLTRRFEFSLQLDRPEEELLRAMAHKRRKNINKALRMGVTIEEMPAEEGLLELRRLQGHSSKRIVARGGRDITYKGLAAEDPAGVLLETDLGRIICARANGEIVSAGLFTCFNGLVYHTLSGHSNQALQTQAPTLLLWESIKWYRRHGAKEFNFGGCSADAIDAGHSEHGIYEYKQAFGTQRLDCVTARKVLRPLRFSAVQALRKLMPG
jgi:hypothetical protein